MHSYEYPRPSVTSDMVVFYCPYKHLGYSEHTEVLLINRADEPYRFHKALPGGYMEEMETTEDAGKRELLEEATLKVDNCSFVGVYDNPNRDSRGRVITVAYWTLFLHKPEVKANDDANSIDWYNIQTLKDLAFDHKQIIRDAWEKFLLTLG